MNSYIHRIIAKIAKVLNNAIKRNEINEFINNIGYIGANPALYPPFDCFNLHNVRIGNNFKARERLKIRTFEKWGGVKFHPQIIIGNNVSIESDCHIGAIDSVIIEDNVLIASFVFISDHLHGESKIEDLQICPSKRSLYSKGGIRICRNVWLGEKSIILSGVTIGEGSIIGAGAVVTHDIPPYCIAGGNPARVIKDLK